MNRTLLFSLLLAAAGPGLAPVALRAALPTFTIVKTGLDKTLGNEGKGVLDPQVDGFTGIAYGAGTFVAVAASFDETVIRWATSPDGVKWTARSQKIDGGRKSYGASKIHFLNGKFIFFTAHSDASGVATTWCYASTNGTSWTAHKVADGRANIEEFDASSSLYVAAAHNGGQFCSKDLKTWTADPVVPDAAGFDHLDCAYGAGHFFSSINGFGGVTYSSTDAKKWTPLAETAVFGGSWVEFGNKVLIFNVGTDRYRSTDGKKLTKFAMTAPTGWAAPGDSPKFRGDQFVATCLDLTTFKSAYATSKDGIAWKPVGYIPASPGIVNGVSESYTISDIAYGNGAFLAAGMYLKQTFFTKTVLPFVIRLKSGASATPAPKITKQPTAQKSVAGGKVTFAVTASGSGLTYQWKLDGKAIAGATKSSLVLSAVQAANAGTYTVVVTNSGGAVTSAAVKLTVTGGKAPTITRIADQKTTEDKATAAIAFTVGDQETPASVLTVTGASSNTKLLPVAKITFGGSGAKRTVKLTPAANQSGTATVTLTVSDGILKTSTSFKLSVTAVNDAPTISRISNKTVAKNGRTAAIAFTIGDAETTTTKLTLTRISSNPKLLPASGIALGGSGAKRTVTLTPAKNQSGTAKVTLTVGDGKLKTSTSFTITVSAAATGTAVARAAPLESVTSRSTVLFRDAETLTVETGLAWTQPLAGLEVSVLLPPGWSFDEGSAGGAEAAPERGDADLLEWTWRTPPAGRATIRFTLRHSPGTSAPATLDGLLRARTANGAIVEQPLAVPTE